MVYCAGLLYGILKSETDVVSELARVAELNKTSASSLRIEQTIHIAFYPLSVTIASNSVKLIRSLLKDLHRAWTQQTREEHLRQSCFTVLFPNDLYHLIF